MYSMHTEDKFMIFIIYPYTHNVTKFMIVFLGAILTTFRYTNFPEKMTYYDYFLVN
jgi:hypothetical protein